jgi:ADP-ribosyl-[dinitrogen reductase] hydrolase
MKYMTDRQGKDLLLETAITGCLLGAAVGDALGLPCEGLSPSRQQRLFPNIDQYHFLFGHGMVSDDTDHACFALQSLLESEADPDLFERRLAAHLRLWLLGVPAGIGLATLKSTMKLSIGVPPSRSGVRSAGNGPAMRSALLGVCFGHDARLLGALVHRSTRITHTDPKAEIGALAVAVAAYVASSAPEVTADAFRDAFMAVVDAISTESETDPHPAGLGKEFRVATDEFLHLFDGAARSAASGESTHAFAESLGQRRGVTGYVYHTVPAVLQTWLRFPEDYRQGVTAIIRAGGDTDSTAAIVGALIGARVGPDGIPKEWLDGLWEWPRSVAWMRGLSSALARMVAGETASPIRVAAWQIPFRNLIFTTAVLAHGMRRMLPPY